jgi:hypothetical protein
LVDIGAKVSQVQYFINGNHNNFTQSLPIPKNICRLRFLLSYLIGWGNKLANFDSFTKEGNRERATF